MNKVGSIRFEVNLNVNDTENYEISLLDLMKQTDKNITNSNKDEIEEMNNYAKQLEKKYGPVAVVKGKKIRVNDFLIQGTGYDADDPFIDDSGTDEAIVVAPDLMTQFGGFFINTDSVKLNESSFVIERVEGDDESTLLSKQHFPHKTNKLTKSQQLLSQAKKRLSTTKKLPIATSNHTLDEIINDVVAIKGKKETNHKIEQDHAKVHKKIEISESVAAVIKSPDKEPTNAVPVAHNGNGNAVNNNHVAQKPACLPPDLPDILTNKINGLVEMAKSCKTDGTKFTNQSSILLMEIDTILMSNSSSKPLRAQVLRYISSTIDVKYDSIVRKINKFKENKRKQVQNALLKSLQDAINEAMPDSLAKYETDMKSYLVRLAAQKLSNAAAAATTAAGDGGVINIDLTTASSQENEPKPKPANKISAPKRNFKWTIAGKALLLNLVTEELESLKNGKMKTGSPEEHLTKFFNASVLGFWPPKWMTNLQLMKISGPIIAEYKSCMTNGKEFKCELPLVKQKNAQKVKVPNHQTNNHIHHNNVAAAVKPPNPPVKHTETKVKLDTVVCSGGPVRESNPTKILISQSKTINIIDSPQSVNAHRLSASKESNCTVPIVINDSPKSRISDIQHKDHKQHTPIANHIQPQHPAKSKKHSPPTASPVSNNSVAQMLPKTVLQTLKSPQSFDQLKRTSAVEINEAGGPPAKAALISRVDNKTNQQQQQQQQQHHQLMQHRGALAAVKSEKGAAQLCNHQVYTNHVASTTNRQSHGHYAHSNNAYPQHLVNNNVSPEAIHKLSNRPSPMQSTIQSISTLLNTPIETRQNIPQHISMMNKSNLTQHNLQQAQNIQRHFMGLQSDFDSPNKALFHQHSNSQPMDLIESPISMNAHQIPPDMYYNFNPAHFNNQRRFQN